MELKKIGKVLDRPTGAIILCLGLKHTKLEIEQLLQENNIDVMCKQETDVEFGFEIKQLAINGFKLELENNSEKSRTGFYIRNSVNYKRRMELEGTDLNLSIVDIYSEKQPQRITKIYRSFNSQGGVSPREKFK